MGCNRQMDRKRQCSAPATCGVRMSSKLKMVVVGVGVAAAAAARVRVKTSLISCGDGSGGSGLLWSVHRAHGGGNCGDSHKRRILRRWDRSEWMWETA